MNMPDHFPFSHFSSTRFIETAVDIGAELHLVNVIADNNCFSLLIQLITYEKDGFDVYPFITDIKEQMVCLSKGTTEPPEEYLVASINVAKDVLRSLVETGEVGSYFPVDFFDNSVLKLKNPKSVEDFEAALRVPSRLGKLITV